MVLAACGIGTLATICGIGVAYAMVKVPKVNADVLQQGSTIYWADQSGGKPEVLARVGASRQIVPLSQISPNMQWAALAIEDHNFYHEPAISPRGILRALYNDLTGGETQGGSTITQQYVKNAYLNQNRTFTRKFKEIFIAIKVNKQLTKQKILENYLNTIYFGAPNRDMLGAYSVETAAQIWYGTTAAKLTVPQAALLAANIKQPGYYTPLSKGQQLADTIKRYDLVLDGMVSMGKLSPADAAKYKGHLPKVRKTSGNSSGQNGYLIQRVTNVLKANGFTEQEIETAGLKIYTTWDKAKQEDARKAVEAKLRGLPKDVRVGLVSINPNNGEVVAAYGGRDYNKRQVDDAFYSTAQVGSSFKPYVLAAALQQGIGLKSKFDASAPAWFDSNGDRVASGTPGGFEVHNDEGNPRQPIVDLITATQMSYNTVYVPLGFKTGTDNVVKLAESAGFEASKLAPHVGQSGLFLGQADESPLVQAGGYATIANDGVYNRPHIIRKVTDSQGNPFHPERLKNYISSHRAFSPEVARDVQYAMQAVVKYPGTGVRAALPGRPVAGKTGTTNGNKSAWFDGFTPHQLVTAVGMWRYDDAVTTGKHKHPGRFGYLTNIGGLARVNGGDFPAEIWHDYMEMALRGAPVKQFDPPAWVGTPQIYATPSPTPTPTPTNTQKPQCLPNQDPTLDNCQPNGQNNQGPGSRFCLRHPAAPSCQTTGTSPPSNPGGNCKPPFTLGCTTPPPDGGGNGPGGNQPNGTQAKAARPLKD